ncbi:hypothetical protein R1flu_015176 [Riccia fluitans]|uniref:Uncharacterized protein n=1 Tax=Riccia fluitans TaxID=41844 RepID=A0ABD1YJ09_9MARC
MMIQVSSNLSELFLPQRTAFLPRLFFVVSSPSQGELFQALRSHPHLPRNLIGRWGGGLPRSGSKSVKTGRGGGWLGWAGRPKRMPGRTRVVFKEKGTRAGERKQRRGKARYALPGSDTTEKGYFPAACLESATGEATLLGAARDKNRKLVKDSPRLAGRQVVGKKPKRQRIRSLPVSSLNLPRPFTTKLPNLATQACILLLLPCN